MDKKSYILATFVERSKILSFLETLIKEHGIHTDKIYVYEVEGNQREFLTTIMVHDKNKYANEFPNSSIMHFKRGCIFSINALNALVERECEANNMSNEQFVVIDWEKYRGKILTVSNGQLRIKKLSKIEDKQTLFTVS